MIFCLDAIPNLTRFLDTTVAPELLYYSYIPIFFIFIFLGSSVFLKNKGSKNALNFLFLTLTFSIWILNIIIQWIAVHSEVVMFAWKLTLLIEFLLLVYIVKFSWSYITGKNFSGMASGLFLFGLLVIAIITPSVYNIQSFDLINCEGEIGPVLYIVYILEFIAAFFILAASFLSVKDKSQKVTNRIVGFASFILLILFSITNLYGEVTQTYEFNLIAPIGMVIFVSLITFLIVRFKAFDIKLLGAQALVWVLVILIGSQFFFIEGTVNQVLVSITLVLSAIVGLMIIRSVKKEVAQREELAVANENQQLLIRFITHQVKGFFTKSKMVFASLLEGDFGDLPEPAKVVVQDGLDSDNKAVDMVQEVLKASSLRSGTMNYDFVETDGVNFVREIAEGFRQMATDKGLDYEINVPNEPITLRIDKLQMTQVIKNLIDNSIKYTPKGYVKVEMFKNSQTVLFHVKDSGFGLSDSDKAKLFREGGRGEESLKLNVNSTGYGLFIVKKIVEGHSGRIWAESAGRDKGSRFCVELPIVKSVNK